jgi:phage-related protein
MGAKPVYRGQKLAVWMYAEGPRCEVEQFLDSLQPKDQRKISRIMHEAADYWPLANRQKCEELHGHPGLFELKANQVRLLCFRDSRGDIILTNGFIKRQEKPPRQEIERALRRWDVWAADEETL